MKIETFCILSTIVPSPVYIIISLLHLNFKYVYFMCFVARNEEWLSHDRAKEDCSIFPTVLIFFGMYG